MGVVTAAAAGGFEFGQRRAAEAVVPRRPARQRLPVLRLVLRGQHRPDLDPARPARPQRRPGHATRPAAWTRWPRPGAQIRKGSPLIVTGGVDGSICPVGLGGAPGRGPDEHRRRPGPRLPAVRPGRRRLRAGRGRRHADPRGRRGGPGTRRAASTARSPGTRPPSTRRPGRPRARPAPGHRAGAGRRRGRGRRHRRGLRRRGGLCRTPTGRRPRPSAAVFGPARRAGHRAQDDDRPAAGRRRRARPGRRAALAARRASSRPP